MKRSRLTGIANMGAKGILRWCWFRGALVSIIIHIFAAAALGTTLYETFLFQKDVSTLLQKSPNYRAIGSGLFNVEQICSDLRARTFTESRDQRSAEPSLLDERYICEIYKINRDRQKELATGLTRYFAILVIIGIMQESFKYISKDWEKFSDLLSKRRISNPDHYYGRIGFTTLCIGLVGETVVQIFESSGRLDLFVLLSPGAAASSLIPTLLIPVLIELGLLVWSSIRPKHEVSRS